MDKRYMEVLQAIATEEVKQGQSRNMGQLTPERFRMRKEELISGLQWLEKQKYLRGVMYEGKKHNKSPRAYLLESAYVTEAGRKMLRENNLQSVMLRSSLQQMKWLVRALLVLAILLLLTGADITTMLDRLWK